MPLDGAMVATKPAGTTAVPNTVVASAPYNAVVDDIYNIFNTKVQPLAGGGSGSATAIGAFDAFNTKGADIATAATVNLDTATGAFDDLTGTTTVTAVTLAAGKHRMTRAAGDFQITVGALLIGNAGGANVNVKAGDLIIWEGYAAGVVRFWTIPISGQSNIPASAYRNRMVNGDKIVSQENAQTSGTTTGRYLSDQNAMFFVTSAGTFTGVNVQTISPAGGYRDRITITTADASLAAGEYLTYTQNLEGSNVRDFKWGAAGANQIVIRFGFKGPAGTYAMALHNNGVTRSYVALFTITAPQANTDTVQTFAVPGDVTGTWLTADGVIGVTMDIVLAAGTTFQGTTGWQAGNILGTSGVSNGMGTAAAVFEFFDCGMRLDPTATGVYGSYEAGYVDPIYRSERYLPTILPEEAGSPIGSGMCAGTGSAVIFVPFLVEAAKKPTGVSVIDSAQYQVLNSTGSGVAATSVTFSTATRKNADLLIGTAGSLTAGNSTILRFINTTVKIYFTGCRLT